VDRRIQRVARAAKSGDKALKIELTALELAKAHLDQGTPLRQADLAEEELARVSELGLITSKPMFFVANVDESDVGLEPTAETPGYVGALVRAAAKRDAEVVVISGKVESEIAQLDPEEREAFLAELGLPSAGLDRLALQGYKVLNLITFFTCGPKETHAWTCRFDALAPQAAGVIHTDFAKGFIRAEVISYGDYVACRGEQGAKEKGLMRLEGKAYRMNDGDVVHFRFNV
jgi:GTP-binding protein YchF